MSHLCNMNRFEKLQQHPICVHAILQSSNLDASTLLLHTVLRDTYNTSTTEYKKQSKSFFNIYTEHLEAGSI